MAKGIFTSGMISELIGTGLENGWIPPSSSFPGQPYDQGGLKCFELNRRQIALTQSALTLRPWGPERD